jgi:hypothetical protein
VGAAHRIRRDRQRILDMARRGTVKYVILIYHNPASREVWEGMPDEAKMAGLRAYAALNEELAASGELIVTQALAEPERTTQVTVRGGQTITTDGPFAEVKEQLAGFYLVECASLERAVEIAAGLPDAEDARLEVRPARELEDFLA